MKNLTIRGFSKEGNWYKGNLHSHTTNSDGMLTPQESVKRFKEHGYHFLCLSEHDKYTDYRSEFNTDDFIMLPGVEASAVLYREKGSSDRLKVHHIHGILGTKLMQKAASEPLFEHGEALKIPKFYGNWKNGAQVAQDLSDSLQKRGCITTYNHPIWSRVREEEFIHTQGIFALEIYNYNTVNESNTGYDETYWDVMLREGTRIHGFASDDNHDEGLFDDACGGYVVVKAEKLTHDEIITNLLKGNYYSSSGPEIYDWGINDGIAYVDCSPVHRIDFIAGNLVNDGITNLCNAIEETITHGQYELKGHEDYVRVKCTDKYGKTAWSNPIFLK